MALPPLLFKKNNQQLWLRAEGSGASFTDSSPAARTVTSAGVANQQTPAMRGNKSAFFTSTALISVADATSIRCTTGDWIVDYLFMFTPAYPTLVDCWMFIKGTGSGFAPFTGYFTLSANTFNFAGFTNASVTAFAFSFPRAMCSIGKPTRFTLSRCGPYVFLFVNGRIYDVAALPVSTVLFSSAASLYVGNISSGIRTLQGYIDEFQLIVGQGCNLPIRSCNTAQLIHAIFQTNYYATKS